VGGFTAPGFESISEAFAQHLGDGIGQGAAMAAYLHGRLVIDVWGGEARPGERWAEDTVVPVFSTSKGAVALVVQLLGDRGALAVDRPVATYWPEFGVNGKSTITLEHVLTHTAGLPTVPDYQDILSHDSPEGWDRREEIISRLATATPEWEPGSRPGYHAITFGWLVGEVVRRVTGRPIGEVFATEIAQPLGMDAWLGRPDEIVDRVGHLIAPLPPSNPDEVELLARVLSPDTVTGRALMVGPSGGLDHVADVANSRLFQQAEIPAANLITDARSIARMYAMLEAGGSLDGVRIVSEASTAEHTRVRVEGHDEVLMKERRYARGYMLQAEPIGRFGPNPDAFGHPGMGGSVGFADPRAGVSFAYVMTQMVPALDTDERSRALVDAVYENLEAPR